VLRFVQISLKKLGFCNRNAHNLPCTGRYIQTVFKTFFVEAYNNRQAYWGLETAYYNIMLRFVQISLKKLGFCKRNAHNLPCTGRSIQTVIKNFFWVEDYNKHQTYWGLETAYYNLMLRFVQISLKKLCFCNKNVHNLPCTGRYIQTVIITFWVKPTTSVRRIEV